MKTRLLLLCLLASALAVSVKGKPHGKHQALPKSSHTAKEKDIVPDEANEGEVLPTFMTFESSSQEQEDENMSYENNANANAKVGPSNKEGVFGSGERSTPILLSDKALVDLLQGVSEEEEVEEEEEGQIESEEAQSEEEEEEEEGEEAEGYLEKEEEEEEEEEEVVEVEAESEKEEEAEKVKVIADEEESVEEEVEDEEESVEEEVEEEEESVEEEVEEEESVEEEVEEEESVEEEVEEEEEEEEEREKEEEEEPVVGDGGVEEEAEVEETDSNTESEIPVDLDYAGDSDNTQPLETEPEEGKPLAVDAQLLSNKEEDAKAEEREEQASKEGDIPTATDGYESQQDVQDAESSENQEVLSLDKLSEGSKDQEKGSEGDSQEKGTNTKDADAELRETKNSVDLDGTRLSVEEGEEQEERNINESASHTKGKARKQRKNQRVRKHPPQRDEAPPGEGVPDHLGDREGEREHYRTTDNAVYKPKRRRAGKWTPLVGMNPVQIRATVDLYPSARPSLAASLYRPQASAADPCENFRCKRGKACKLNEEKPTCVCQEPSACPQSVTDYDHVCGTDNVTYDTSCELFATKCNLEGTKRGHRLHLDYTGPCKFIAPCTDAELVQFPLRMRDWLKNVLLQLYEHDSVSHGFLTPKQRIRVRKIHESERRLRAGDHPVELLTQDFEKNYNMYIYPVHWQFAQMDQHPSDRFLSHSELAPLRVPLVPMEHCTSRFFQECEADKDKQVSFREWAHCFGIKDEDMDVNLLF